MLVVWQISRSHCVKGQTWFEPLTAAKYNIFQTSYMINLTMKVNINDKHTFNSDLNGNSNYASNFKWWYNV